MLNKIRKPKSIRKTLTGKRVKIKSHASPSLRKHVGTIVNVVKNAKFMVIDVDAIPPKIIPGDGVTRGDRTIHLGAPSRYAVVPREGLELV